MLVSRGVPTKIHPFRDDNSKEHTPSPGAEKGRELVASRGYLVRRAARAIEIDSHEVHE